MKYDESKWDKRYREGSHLIVPVEIVERYCGLAKAGGRALDIAAGTGRHSVLLAEKGFQVDAVDISSVGLDTIRKRNPGINTLHADLDSFQIKENHYDLILNINFLQRRLFPYIKQGLKKDGILIFQTFMDPRLVGAPLEKRKQDQYLNPNELLHAFISLQVLFYQEKEVPFSNKETLMAATLIASNQR